MEAHHSEDMYSFQVKQFHSLLMDLHRDLLDYQGEIMSDQLQRKLSPFEMWDMSIKHHDFVWLRKLSELIVLIDETMEEGKIEKQFVSFLKFEVKGIFFSEEVSDFKARLTMALDRRPELHFLTGRLRRLIS